MKKIFKIQLLLILGSLWFLGCNQHVPDNTAAAVWTINESTLEAAIVNEFKSHPEVKYENIKVTADDGVITLTGTVDDLLQKENARNLVTMIRGVKSVINMIDVDTPFVPDKELEKNIEDALYRDPVLEAYKIGIDVDTGVVNLYGKVDSWHEKQLAEEVVSGIEGITKVNNNIAFVFDGARPPFEIKSDISSLLRNDIRIDDGKISVEVKTDTAILSGTVGSAAEKSLAIVHAYVPGVDTVKAANLEVAPNRNDPLLREDKYVEKSDFEIIEAIQETYLQDPRLLDHDIKVSSENGKVTLTGAVNNLRAKKAAESDARNVVGVWQVENKINVEPVMMPVEKTVKDNVQSAIDHHPMFEDYTIHVESDKNGKATLTGTVNYFYEKKQAEDIASGVPGIVDIANKIEVAKGINMPYAFTPATKDYPVLKQPVLKDDGKIKEDVAYQLWWSPFVDRNQIEISVDNGTVTLKGTVNTAFEMDQAVKNAYEGGAFAVNNELKVEFWQI